MSKEAKKLQEEIQPPYTDDLTVREVYAELCQSLFGGPGIVRIELCVNRWTTQAPVARRCRTPVARAAMHVSLAKAFRDQLTRCIEVIENPPESPAAQMPPASPTVQ